MSDMFIQLKGIKGESTDDKHKEWIEMLSFSKGVTQEASATKSTAGGGTSARANFPDFHFTKLMDAASPTLELYCASGQHIDEVKVELCRASGESEHKLVYMTYTMADVIISSYNVSGGDNMFPVESLSLNFAKIEQEYKQQKREGGTAAGSVKSGWDLKANKKV